MIKIKINLTLIKNNIKIKILNILYNYKNNF